MTKSTQYEGYLKDKHSKLQTPEKIIDEAVKEATNQLPISKNRLIHGEVNEVYDVKLADQENVIVRISHHTKFDFEQEKWAIEKCENAGVLVPKVLLVKHTTIGDKDISLCIQRKLPGEPIYYKDGDWTPQDTSFYKKISIRAGEELSKIHAVKTEGFGYINKNGIGEFKTFKDLVFEELDQKEIFAEIAENVGLGSDFILKVIDILEKNEKYYSCDNPCLNHGDFSPSHIMVENEEVTGIIDFGGVRSGPPILDFSWWNFWKGYKFPIEWLKEGYQNKEIFDENFDFLLRLMGLHWGLVFIKYCFEAGNLSSLDHAKRMLLQDAKSFGIESF